MEKLVYVAVDGTKETSYDKVKGTEYETTLEPVVEVETEEEKQARLDRIARRQAYIKKAYDEYKRLEEERLTNRTIGVELETAEEPVIAVTLE
jgi:hypothetical protein